MQQLLNFQTEWLLYIILMFLRISGMFFMSPIFGRRNIPAMMKAGFSLILAIVFVNVFPPQNNFNDINVIDFTILSVKELLIGFVLGFITSAFFYITYAAGQLIDMQIGLSIAQVYDPALNSSTPITGGFLYTVLLIYFFTIDGHLMLIKLIYATFGKIPVGQVEINLTMVNRIIEAFVLTFTMAFTLALPIVAASLLVEVALGIVVKSVPQMNIFVVGMPLKIFMGFVMLFLMVPIFSQFCNSIFDKMYNAAEFVFNGMVQS